MADTDTQLITAVEVLPGNAPDNLGALELVEQSETNTGVPVEEAVGDAAYGDGATRQTFADAGRRLVARVPGRPNRKHFPKDDFVIDLAAGSCTCPAGQVTHTIVPAGKRTDGMGRVHRWEGRACSLDIRADRGGPPPWARQQAELKAAVQELPGQAGIGLANWNWKVVSQFVEERFGVSLSRSSCLNWLHRLGFCLQASQEALGQGRCSQTGVFRGGVRRPAGGGGTHWGTDFLC